MTVRADALSDGREILHGIVASVVTCKAMDRGLPPPMTVRADALSDGREILHNIVSSVTKHNRATDKKSPSMNVCVEEPSDDEETLLDIHVSAVHNLLTSDHYPGFPRIPLSSFDGRIKAKGVCAVGPADESFHYPSPGNGSRLFSSGLLSLHCKGLSFLYHPYIPSSLL